MDTINVEITGDSPLLMHRFPMEDVSGYEKLTPEKQAELAAYIMPGGENLYIPGAAVYSALVGGGKLMKGKGRASLSTVVAGAVMIDPEFLDLGTHAYTIDKRIVVNPATRGRIPRYRPRLDSWKASFDLRYDPTALSEKQVRELVDTTGQRIGLLDFRPQTRGPFGRFKVTSWKAV